MRASRDYKIVQGACWFSIGLVGLFAMAGGIGVNRGGESSVLAPMPALVSAASAQGTSTTGLLDELIEAERQCYVGPAVCGQLGDAVETVAMMEAGELRGMALAGISYAHATAGMWDEATQLLRVIEEDQQIWIARALALVGSAQINAGLFDEAEGTATAIALGIGDCIEGVKAMAVIAMEFAAQGSSVRADRVFSLASDYAGPALCLDESDNGLVHVVLAQSVSTIDDGNGRSSLQRTTRTWIADPYAWLTSALAGVRNVNHAAAFSTAYRIEEPHWRIHALVDIARSQLSSGMPLAAQASIALALQTAPSVELEARRIDGLLRIASAQADARLPSAARDTFAAILELGETPERVARVQARAGMYADALETAQTADVPLRPAVILEVARSRLWTRDSPDRVNVAVQIALSVANPALMEAYPEGRADAIATMTDFASELAEAGYPDQALSVVSRAVEAAEGTTDEDRDLVSLYLARAHAALRSWTVAFATAETVADDALRNRALGDIAIAQARTHLFEEALDTVALIDDSEIQPFILATIGRAFADAGRLDEALSIAAQVDNEDERSALLQHIAIAQALAAVTALDAQ